MNMQDERRLDGGTHPRRDCVIAEAWAEHVRVTAEAWAERDRVIAEARAERDRVIAEARAERGAL